MMTADVLAVDEDLVVRRAADDNAAKRERVLRDKLAVSKDLDRRHIFAGRTVRVLLEQLPMASGSTLVLLPVKLFDRGLDVATVDAVLPVGKRTQQRRVA